MIGFWIALCQLLSLLASLMLVSTMIPFNPAIENRVIEEHNVAHATLTCSIDKKPTDFLNFARIWQTYKLKWNILFFRSVKFNPKWKWNEIHINVKPHTFGLWYFKSLYDTWHFILRMNNKNYSYTQSHTIPKWFRLNLAEHNKNHEVTINTLRIRKL